MPYRLIIIVVHHKVWIHVHVMVTYIANSSNSTRSWHVIFYFLFFYFFYFTVVTTIMVQFRQVNQYRWPGYFIAVLSVVYCGAFLLLFRPQHKSVTTAITEREGLTETERRDREQMHSRSCKVCSGLACRRRSLPTFKEIFVSCQYIAY